MYKLTRNWRFPITIVCLALVYLIASMATWTSPFGVTIADGNNFLGRWRWSVIDGHTPIQHQPIISGWYWVDDATDATWRITASGAAELRINDVVVFSETVAPIQTTVPVQLRAGANFFRLVVTTNPTENPAPLIAKLEEPAFLPQRWRYLEHTRTFPNEPGTDPGMTLTPAQTYERARREKIAGWIIIGGLLWLMGIGVIAYLRRYPFWRWRISKLYLAIFILNLIPRWIVVSDRIRNDPDIFTLSSGTDNYIALAREVLNGSYSLVSSLWGPGNILWLAGVQFVNGLDAADIHRLHAGLGALASVFVVDLARRLYGWQAAKVTGILTVFYMPLLVYQSSSFVSGAGTSFFVIMIWAIVIFVQQHQNQAHPFFPIIPHGIWILVGMLVAINSYFRTSNIVIVAVIPIVLWGLTQDWRNSIFKVVPILVVALLFFLPLMAENYVIGAGPVLSSNGPQNIHLGNNETAVGDFSYSPTFLAFQYRNYDSRWQAIYAGIQDDPWRAGELLLHKIGLLWKGSEDGSLVNVEQNGSQVSLWVSAFYQGGVFNFSVIAFFAILGFLWTPYQQHKLAAILPLTVIFYTLSIAIVFSLSRFRALLIPILMIAAGYSIARLRTIVANPSRHNIRSVGSKLFMALLILGMLWLWETQLPRPRLYATETLPEEAASMQVTFGDSIQLIGYEPLKHTVEATGVIHSRLYFARVGDAPNLIFVTAQLLSSDGASILANSGDWQLGSTGHPDVPVSEWGLGRGQRDEFFIPLPASLPPSQNDVYYLGIALINEDGSRIPVTDSPNHQTWGDMVIIKSFWVDDTPQSLTEGIDRQIVVGDAFSLQRSSVPSQVEAGTELIAVLQWQSLQDLYQDYQRFVVLLDAQNQVVAQIDAPMFGQGFPSSALLPNQTRLVEVRLTVPEEIPEGTYQLGTGLYNLMTLQRLTVQVGTGDPLSSLPNDVINLGTVQVIKPLD